jgi:hypothetical protein
MKIAQNMNVLDAGIPAVVMFSKEGGEMENIMAGDLLSYEAIMKKVKNNTHHLERSKDGFFLKGT